MYQMFPPSQFFRHKTTILFEILPRICKFANKYWSYNNHTPLTTTPMDEIDYKSVAERIKYLIKFSRLNQQTFATKIGVDPANLSKYLSGRIPMTENLLNRIVVNMGVSKAWLRDGTDVPFSKDSEVAELGVDEPKVLSPSSRRGAPVYDIDVTAGCHELSSMFTQDRVVGFLDLPELDPSSAVIHVSGDSMAPTIKNGSYIAIHALSPGAPIVWGQIYVIVLDDYRLVKRVRRHDDKSMVILHSDNPAYDDMEVRREDIRHLYIVQRIISCEILY